MERKKEKKEEKIGNHIGTHSIFAQGITLIALIVTIIIMLILAGIILSITIGEHGIIKKAEMAKQENEKAQIQEEIQLEVIDVITEEIEKNKKIANEKIQKGLVERLKGIEVQEDLTGSYKQYEYWIDEEYQVHVEEKTTNPITVKIEATYVGTSSSTVKVEASSKEGNIVGYQYKIGNTQTEQLTRRKLYNRRLRTRNKIYNIS